MRYSSSFARSRSSAPARTISLTGIAELLDDPGHVLGAHRLAVAVVDDDDRPPPAAGRRAAPARSGAPAGSPSARPDTAPPPRGSRRSPVDLAHHGVQRADDR